MSSTEPYEFAYQFMSEPFKLARIVEEMAGNAKAVKVSNFKKIFQEYVRLQSQKNPLIAGSVTQFSDQPIELDCGQWRADDTGVYIDGMYGEVCACPHPIMPVQRLVNIDTGIEKLRIAYRKQKQWRYAIVEKKVIASNSSIVELSNLGIAVTSETAKHLVRYLHDVETLNYEKIPECSAVSRLGWINEEGFAPYVEDLIFDGDANFRHFFESVKAVGSFDKWIELAKKVRKGRVPARIILAASFASAAVKPLSCLPFFVHLWGGTEAGKTVALMLAASVWASPEMGRYIHTFNSTSVGMEKSAAFCNSMPLILDEFQMISSRKGFDEDVMKLAEGVGKTRGNKLGGVDKAPTWANCILTNGEMPITGGSSGGGVVNRIIEIECIEKLFDNPRGIVEVVKKNYGHAGELFTELLQKDDVLDEARNMFNFFYDELCKSDTTEKQAMAAAAILTADAIATVYIFKDDAALTVEDISEFLQDKASVSVNRRGYEYLCEYVVTNSNKFCGDSAESEVWGKTYPTHVSIIRAVYNKICSEAGFNQQALLSWMGQNNLIIRGKETLTSLDRINGMVARCVKLIRADSENE